MSGRVDQILAGLADGDAISQEAIEIRDLLRAAGVQSELYADRAHVSPTLADECRGLSDYDGGAGDVLIYHHAIASEATPVFTGSAAKKVLIYHNTPDHFFAGYDDGIRQKLVGAREELKAILPQVDAVWADSQFNADELVALGREDVQVFPLLFSHDRLDVAADHGELVNMDREMTTWLYVGRIAPNKGVETLIEAFAWYDDVLDPNSRLVIVGSDRSAPRYFLQLRMLATELKQQNVCFSRFVSPAGLVAYYERADVFVTASRHEGYCLPLVEAMHKGLPVVARDSGGMPEALGGGGVRFADESPEALAALVHKVIHDAVLRERVLAAQATRMQQVLSRDAGSELKALLAPLSA